MAGHVGLVRVPHPVRWESVSLRMVVSVPAEIESADLIDAVNLAALVRLILSALRRRVCASRPGPVLEMIRFLPLARLTRSGVPLSSAAFQSPG